MDDYPDPEEEYDLIHEEEMEVMLEMEREMSKAYPEFKPKKSKNSLNFDNVSSGLIAENSNEIRVLDCDVSKNCNDNVSNKINKKDFRKRCLSLESLTDLNSDLEIVERPSKKLKSYKDLKTNDSCSEKEYGITSFRVPNWPFMTVRNHEGDRLYVKLNDRHKIDCVPCINNKSISKMLVIPYKDLKALIEEAFLKKLANNETDDDLMEIEVLSEADLWVEKFKPKTYFDLLSDEAINRTLLNWLKLWDKIVFNKEVKEKPNKGYNKENKFQKDFNKVLDADNRPYFKVALLCGPPGLGKTTLAHIAAVMAGYNIVEVNASDDRSIEALNAKLDNATQMQAVMGKCKPNCLILDEIDGAPAQTVDFLLKYLNGKYKSKKGKKEQKYPDIVKRPVICICNELYTPSLRQLRQQAFVIHFPNTSSSKLVQRLLEICKKQDIKTDLTALTLLCDKAQNDIRSCISTLHFFKNKNSQRFKSNHVLDAFMGQKDIQKSVFNIWKEIFHNPIGKISLFLKVQKKEIEDEMSSCVNYSQKEMNKLQSLIQNCQASGDYDRLCEGVFENFLKSKFSGGMESVYKGLEWFCWFDLLDTNIKKNQNYFLMSYLPYSFGMWQTLYSSNNFWKITYPTTGYENSQVSFETEEVVLKILIAGKKSTIRFLNTLQQKTF